MGSGVISLGWDEARKLPRAEDGQKIVCGNCGKRHIIREIKDKDGHKCTGITTFKCGGKVHIAGIMGRLMFGHSTKT